MAAFAEWQGRYAEHGVATFPVAGKKPAVKGYLKIGPALSGQLAMKFLEADAFGFALGQRNRITVLDVDTPDVGVLREALARHGRTPIIVRSGSGNHQAWDRHNGERRRIRPWRELPIDILGHGYVVAPPSRGTRGEYKFIKGTLDDLDHLPCLKGFDTKPETSTEPNRAAEGTRNDTLWRLLMAQAHHCDDLEQLLDVARHQNASFTPPLADDEVVKTAGSAWGYEERGENYVGVGHVVRIDHALIDGLMQEHPDAFVLLMKLRRLHWGRDFILANAMADVMPDGGWRRQRFAVARKHLEDAGLLVLVKAAGWRGPPVYRLSKGWPNLPTNRKPNTSAPLP